MHEMQWWLDRLNNVRPVGEGYTALCPAHNDHQNSLSIRELPDGGVLVHCFRECDFKDIVEILENGARSNGNKIFSLDEVKGIQIGAEKGAREAWETYTQVPSVEWELWDVSFTKDKVIFGWRGLPTKKERTVIGDKVYRWTPDGSPRPPLWPILPEELPEQIWITEGESDCGVLRHLGYQAFGLTKGASSIGSLEPIWYPISLRGVKKVIYIADLDEAGMKSLHTLGLQAGSDISFYTVNLREVVDPLLGEKDIRDLWGRIRSPTLMRDCLEKNIKPLGLSDSPQRVSLQELLEMTMPPLQWVVKDILLKKTTSLIVGSPKIGKSWLSLDLGISIATETPFLGHFETFQEGSVLYIAKEDPDFALQDRVAKILVGKGLGGSVEKLSGGTYQIHLPSRRDYPFFVDLSRSFVFSEVRIDELLEWLRRKEIEIGDISLIIFDPILRMIGEEIDEYKATDINRSIFDPAARIVQEFGASVTLVHHRTKGGISGKSSYGSIAFHAFSDSTLYIHGEQPDKEGWVAVSSEFKSAAEGRWKYRFAELSERYRVEVSESADVSQRTSEVLRDDLLVFLSKRDKGTLVTDIDNRFSDVDISTIRTILKELEGEQLVYRTKEPAKTPGSKGGPRRDLWFVSLGED